MPSPLRLRKQMLILCVCIAVCFGMIYESARFYLAWKWGDSGRPAMQLRAADLAPGNAEAWDRLGRAAESNFDQIDPRHALNYFKRSVAVDPHSAEYWLDLASAYELNGENSQARAAYSAAQHVYPISAEVAWKYGNFLLRENDTAEGLAQIRSATNTDPALLSLALSSVWSFDPDIQVVMKILPSSASAYSRALIYFSQRRQAPAALEIWNRLLAIENGKNIELQSAFPLLDELIAEQRARDATRVWSGALAAAAWPNALPENNSRVWNGGFEVKTANGGLGWRIEQIPGAYISTDESERHSGSRSLRVDFTGGMNLDFAAVSQFVPVEPNQSYTLSGYIKTRDISTESGMRLEVRDTVTGKIADTDQLTGSHDWTSLSCTFQTGPATQFLEIFLRRLPSRLFNNQLGGTVWLDDVSLAPTDANTSAGGAAK